MIPHMKGRMWPPFDQSRSEPGHWGGEEKLRGYVPHPQGPWQWPEYGQEYPEPPKP